MNEERELIKLKVEQKLAVKKQELINLLPERLKLEFASKSFIGGGCIYSLYNNEIPKDYDFFLTDNALMEMVREYFENINNLKDCGIVRTGFYKNNKLIVSDNAISIGEYQIITKWVGDLEYIVSQFDFKHNMFYYFNGKLDTLSDYKYLENKKLKYNEERARDICGTIMRVPKFIERGMEISKYEMSKMLIKLSEVGFDEREMEILHTTQSFDS